MKKRTILIVCLLLTICVIAASLFLPEMIIKGTDSQTLEKVNAADKSYSPNTIEAYSGKLDLYRKLLLLKGIWKSEYESKTVAHINSSSGLLVISDTQEYWDMMEGIRLVNDYDLNYEESLDEAYGEDEAIEGVTINEKMGNRDINIEDFLVWDTVLIDVLFRISDIEIPDYNRYYDYNYGCYKYYFPIREDAFLRSSKLTLVEKRSYTDTALQKYSFDILVCTFEFESDLEELSENKKVTATLYWDLEENQCLALTTEITDNIFSEEEWKQWLEFKVDYREFIDYEIMQPSLKEDGYRYVEVINDVKIGPLGILDMNGKTLSDDKENFVYKCYDDNKSECIYFVMSYTKNSTEIYYTIAASE